MYKFIEKSIRRKFVKNANERGHKFLAKNSKVPPPANSKTRTNSAIVYKGCFMEIRFVFLTDEKYWRLDCPRGRKFGVIDTPQNFEVQPPISPKRIEKPPNFFHLCIKRSDIGKAAKLYELTSSRFRTIRGQKIFKGGPFPQMGVDSPFVLKLLDTVCEIPLTF